MRMPLEKRLDHPLASRLDVIDPMELYAEGLSSINIGKQLGFDNHTVLSALRAQGVPIRKALGR